MGSSTRTLCLTGGGQRRSLATAGERMFQVLLETSTLVPSQTMKRSKTTVNKITVNKTIVNKITVSKTIASSSRRTTTDNSRDSTRTTNSSTRTGSKTTTNSTGTDSRTTTGSTRTDSSQGEILCLPNSSRQATLATSSRVRPILRLALRSSRGDLNLNLSHSLSVALTPI